MSQPQQDFTKIGFVKTFVLPALLVFLVPVIGCVFFLHAQERFDANARESVLQQIKSDPKLSEQDRTKAIAFFNNVPFSQLIRDKEFAANVDPTMLFHYATFRWMIRLSVLSVVGGVGVFLLAGICVLVSLRSQLAQFLSLSVGWQVLRIYGALQTIVMGVLLVALSFWMTALWFNVYYVKLMFAAGAVALLGVVVVIKAIFTNPKHDFIVEGTILNNDMAEPLWKDLLAICKKVGATPPDQIIAGIDDSFFVTEQPVTVEGHVYRGKSLFVSLPLLKQLHSAEADAILAHEMAHFSGQDTLYSRRIAPLLQRYNAYLQNLHEGGVTIPIFYFMLCFRALFELSLGKISRQREFRADKIAATITSPRDFASALLRTIAYSKFRGSVESDLFKQEQALETANVSDRIESGFAAYAVAFASEQDIGLLETAHPFDSHPPTLQRLSALGVQLSVEETQALLGNLGDGGWHRNISDASEMERKQWQVYEERFRNYHEQSLPFRFLPATPEEQAIVEKAFPPITIESQQGTLSLDFEKIHYVTWTDPLLYSDITRCTLSDEGVLSVFYNRPGELSRTINTKKFGKDQQQQVLGAFQHYYGRYLTAVEYQKQVKAAGESKVAGEAVPDTNNH